MLDQMRMKSDNAFTRVVSYVVLFTNILPAFAEDEEMKKFWRDNHDVRRTSLLFLFFFTREDLV